MTEAWLHRGVQRLVQLRWILPLVSAVLLLCFSGANAQAHGPYAPVKKAVDAVSNGARTAAVMVVVQTRDGAALGARSDHECPGGSSHADHTACAGISCHAAADDAGPTTDFQSSPTDYERLATGVGDGRAIAPLFHPPKI
jgi:hypothetical protein